MLDDIWESFEGDPWIMCAGVLERLYDEYPSVVIVVLEMGKDNNERSDEVMSLLEDVKYGDCFFFFFFDLFFILFFFCLKNDFFIGEFYIFCLF